MMSEMIPPMYVHNMYQSILMRRGDSGMTPTPLKAHRTLEPVARIGAGNHVILSVIDLDNDSYCRVVTGRWLNTARMHVIQKPRSPNCLTKTFFTSFQALI